VCPKVSDTEGASDTYAGSESERQRDENQSSDRVRRQGMSVFSTHCVIRSDAAQRILRSAVRRAREILHPTLLWKRAASAATA
jgi:hypothetical protein